MQLKGALKATAPGPVAAFNSDGNSFCSMFAIPFMAGSHYVSRTSNNAFRTCSHTGKCF